MASDRIRSSLKQIAEAEAAEEEERQRAVEAQQSISKQQLIDWQAQQLLANEKRAQLEHSIRIELLRHMHVINPRTLLEEIADLWETGTIDEQPDIKTTPDLTKYPDERILKDPPGVRGSAMLSIRHDFPILAEKLRAVNETYYDAGQEEIRDRTVHKHAGWEHSAGELYLSVGISIPAPGDIYYGGKPGDTEVIVNGGYRPATHDVLTRGNGQSLSLEDLNGPGSKLADAVAKVYKRLPHPKDIVPF